MTTASQEGDFIKTSTDNSLLWLPKSNEPGHTRGSHVRDVSIRYFMPRSHEALGQSTGPIRAKPVQMWEITRRALRVGTMFR